MDGATPDKTKVYKDINANGVLDDPDIPVELTNAAGSLEDGYDLSTTIVYCIGIANLSYTTHTGDILVTMIGGTVKEINGSMFCDNIGNFIFSMSGGYLDSKVVSTGSASTWDGSTYVSISGDALIAQAVYGGSENGNCTITGDVNIHIADNVQINTDDRYGDACVVAGGQQPDDTIKGNASVSIEGGLVNGVVAGDLFNTLFEKDVRVRMSGGKVNNLVGTYNKGTKANSVTVSVTGGEVNYNVIGSRGEVSANATVTISDGTFNSTVAGAYGGNVKGGIYVNIDGGNFSSAVIGLVAADAVATQVNVRGGTIAQNVIGHQGGGNCPETALYLTGGTIHGFAMLRADDTVPVSPTAVIGVEQTPGFGANGAILLRSGEYVKETGTLTVADSSIPIDTGLIDEAGTLVVQSATGSSALRPKYKLMNSSFNLLYGRVGQTEQNLYLGNETALGEYTVETVVAEGAAVVSSDLNYHPDAYRDESDNTILLQGSDIKIVLSIDNADMTVDEQTKSAIEAIDSKKIIAQYLDIYATKYVDNQEVNKLNKLQQEIEFVVQIPEQFKSPERNFSMIFADKQSDGRILTAVLQDEDSDSDTITFHSDTLGIYAIAYTECLHSAATDWMNDEVNHWQLCIHCGTKLNVATHTFTWVMDKEATATEAGLKHEECTVCGYKKAAQEIPPTGTQPIVTPETDNQNKLEIPSTTDVASPDTGDYSNVALWLMAMVTTGIALIVIILYNCKRKSGR